MLQILSLILAIGIIITVVVFRKVIFKSFYDLNRYADSLAKDYDEENTLTQKKETKDE